MRINGFNQIKAFYSWIFDNQDKDIKPQHISLYLFLLNQNNRANWIEWFKCPYDLAMTGSCIGSKKTYYNCLNDLQDWKLIEYKKGANNWKAPKIKLEVLICTSSVPLSEPLPTPLPIQLPTPLPTHKYKPITDKPKTDNNKQVVYSKEVNDCYYEIINFFSDSLIPKTYSDKNNWLDTIDKLNRLDKIPFEIIIKIVKQVRQDQFWSKNFQSINKLRTKNKDGVKYVVSFYEKFKNTITNETRQPRQTRYTI